MKKITNRDNKGRIKKGNGLKHGMSNKPIYDCWIAMKARCLNVRHPHYGQYGGRGIKVCNRWLESFENFYADMGDMENGYTLDRIDPNGDYEQKNCRWVTIQQQQINKTNSTKTPGVELHHGKQWVVRIHVKGKRIYLGSFRDRDEAYKIRKEAELKYW